MEAKKTRLKLLQGNHANLFLKIGSSLYQNHVKVVKPWRETNGIKPVFTKTHFLPSSFYVFTPMANEDKIRDNS